MSANQSVKHRRKKQFFFLNFWFVALVILINCCHVLCGQDAIEITFSVPENVSIGSTVGHLPSSGLGSFIFIDQDESFATYFDTQSLQSSGEVKTTSTLDHETNSLFDAILINETGAFFKVEILVTDVNDNSPTFPESVVSFHISEASQIGSKFDIGSATDEDSYPYNVKGYRITDGNSGQFFRIGTRTLNNFTFADLIVNKSLNREEIPFFTLTIEAYDGGTPSNTGSLQLNINITDANDNAPMFDLTRYTVTIKENTDIGADVISLTASDSDINENGFITYRIDRSQSDPDEFFLINSTTGQITLNKKLNFEDQVQHKVVVEAVDQGSEPLIGSTVVIVTVEDVNDNKPTLEVIFLGSEGTLISEAIPLGTFVARVSVSDPDTGQISSINVTLSGGDDKFSLVKTNNNTYLITLINDLNREVQSIHVITLTATDSGSDPLSTTASYTLTVGDVNDNPPRFSQDLYQISLDQLSAGTYVIQLQANDIDEGINAEVTYSLASTNQSDWFMINRDSGLITTRQMLDPSVNAAPRLVVIATDKGSPSLSSNTTLVVSIAGASDEAPQFVQSSYTVSVLENVTVGECILKAQVSNGEDSILSYSIASTTSPQQPFDQFRINVTTGDVCVTSSLDRETISNYNFELRATNQDGRYGRAFLHVIVNDVNEFAPVFFPVMYLRNVDRNAEVNFPITQVTATDADDVTSGQITYAVTTGNDESLFELDIISGQLSVATSLADVEIGTTYQLNIAATDERGMTSSQSANVTIVIVDGDLLTGAPTFSSSSYDFEIDENAQISTVLGRISADSQDGSIVTYQIRHDPPNSNWFKINQSHGDLIVAARLDREIFQTVTFEVIASSGIPPLYSFAVVTISLNDVNDNPPHFYRSSGGALPPLAIPYSLSPGSVFGSVTATDLDYGENGNIEYSLSSPLFDINSTTGQLSLTTLLEPNEADYQLTIEARDQGTPSLSSVASLTVHVRHPDISCPVFLQSNYNFRILENFPPTLSFGAVNFTAASTVTLNIFGSSAVVFALHPNGSLYLNQAVDREVQDRYLFTVAAFGIPAISNLKRFCSATATVIVTIDDVNDNPPEFSRSLYVFNVSENFSAGTEIGSVGVSDRDIVGHVTYQLAVLNPWFIIHPTSGAISTSASLGHETARQHDLLIYASDGENFSEASVLVNVLDINDNSPTFLTGALQHLAVVLANSDADTWIADMTAVDTDGGQNGNLSYSIDNSSLFKIDPKVGTVTTNIAITQGDTGIHSLRVTVQDHGTPSRTSSVILMVNIRSSFGNPAQFNDTQFVFTPFEDAKIGQSLGSVDGSSSERLRVRRATSYPLYRILSGNHAGTFSVNETTGEMMLRRKLDHETLPQSIIQMERRDGSDVTFLIAQINIRDVNDRTPTFTSGTFYINVEENTEIGKEVWRFTATDEDSGLNGQVRYSLIHQDPVRAFIIDPNSGSLLVDAALDRENVSEYLLVINASDSSLTSPRFSTASCVVTLRDVNDNSPQILSRSEIDLAEDKPIGYPVIRFIAHDPDAGANGHVIFSLVSARSRGSEDRDLFFLDPTTGILTLTSLLDYETENLYILNISVSDSSTQNPLIRYQNLTIRITDVNDVAPRFERLVYDAEVAEGQSSGVIVTRVEAVDGDFEGVNKQFTYSIPNSSDSRNFAIDVTTGVITTLATLDRETQDSYTLIVVAEDSSLPPHYDSTTVNVTVIDINDNPPRYTPLDRTTNPPTLVRLELPEQTGASELVYELAAWDRDMGENARISYFIADGNNNGDFFLNSSTGELRTFRQLDREQTGLYQLRVVATDHGQPPRSNEAVVDITVLDWNDNNPEFEREFYTANITEELSRGQYVVTVRANDADDGLNGVIRYFLAPPDSSPELGGAFDIDEATGVVTTATMLNRENVAHFELFVTAVDSSPINPRNATVSLTIQITDINDNSPEFESHVVRINVSRSEQTGTMVGRLGASDIDIGDNAVVQYSLSDTPTNSYFNIDASSGDVTVGRPLNPIPSPFAFTVVATDQGVPPRSSKAVVIVMTADQQAGSQTRLEFDEISNPRRIWETAQIEFSVETVTASIIGNSGDISDVTYDIMAGNEDGNLFSVSQGGAVTVSEPSLLDYERKPRISLIISANATNIADGSILYAFATIDVEVRDDNDNSPTFSQLKYYSQINEGQSPAFVTQLFASDADSGDNGEIRYDLLSSTDVFEVDSSAGILRTTRSLDREVDSKYELVVHATDFGEFPMTGTCTVVVDVVDINDHEPTLVVPSLPLLVLEDTEVGSLVTIATANDVDINQVLSFNFSPQDGNPGQYFSIDRYSGRIFLTSPLDRETQGNITLHVEASDGVYSASASIEILIGDVNDNEPAFKQLAYFATIDEFSLAGTPLLAVNATDADSGDNGRVSYRISSISPNHSLFVIDSDSGLISINQMVTFSPESSVFNLEIEAFDHGSPSKAKSVHVRIEVIDINNHAPEFNQAVYEAYVIESVARDYSVINIMATDADFTRENKDFYFQIVAGNTGDKFFIETKNGETNELIGELRTALELDREEEDFYELTVTAIDQGHPQLSSNATIRVRILDENDNKPRFNASRYYGNVTENNEQNEPRDPMPVLSVYAIDDDSAIASNFRFSIISGNDNGLFTLGECTPPSTSCIAILVELVDFETSSMHHLTIQVTDDSGPVLVRSHIAEVLIYVINVNEYSPTVQPFQRVHVEESLPVGWTLFYISASDGDAGYFGQINFSVLNENSNSVGTLCLPPQQLFTIEDLTGAVITTQNLDYETCQMISFRYEACDPDNCVTSSVEVNVLPVDEFAPQFVGTNPDLGFQFSVPYGSPPGFIVGAISATDADSGEDGSVEFSLEESSSVLQSMFVINNSTGVISLSNTLDSSNSHILTLTAASGNRRTSTHVTVNVTDVPAMGVEAIILAIVFGVVVVIALIVVGVLCWKRKRQLAKKSESSETNENNYATARGSNSATARKTSQPEFYDLKQHHEMAHIANGSSRNGNLEKGDVIKNGGAGDFQLRTLTSINGNASKAMKIPVHLEETKLLSYNKKGSKVDSHHHRHPKSPPVKPPETDESAEDEEVIRITSTPSSSGVPSSSTPSVFSAKHRVADSGIQQDIDKASDVTDTSRPRHQSFKGIDNIKDYGGGEGVPLPHPGIQSINNGEGERMPPKTVKLDPELNSHPSGLLGYLESLDDVDYNPGKTKKTQEWTPDFQPLSSVFSEIARFREESLNEAPHRVEKPQLPLHYKSRSVGETPGPPPLLTSVLQQNEKLTAPVPLSTQPSGSHVPLRGLYPRPVPHYQNSQKTLPPLRSNLVPPSYSLVMSSRPSSGGSIRSRSSLHGQSRTAVSFSLPPSISGTISGAPSFRITPISHQSSLASPAMSPSVSPSLSPLTTNSPLTFELSNHRRPTEDVTHTIMRDTRSHSGRKKTEERMLHV